MILCIATLLIVIVLHQSNSVLIIHVIISYSDSILFCRTSRYKTSFGQHFLEQELLIGGTVYPTSLLILMLFSELIFHGLCAVISLMLDLSVFYCILFCCVFYVAIVFCHYVVAIVYACM